MTDEGFVYDLVLADDRRTTVNVIAYQERPGQGLRGIVWNGQSRQWIYAPAIVADILYDDSDPTPVRSLDRAAAEKIATEQLQSELPSEPTLTLLCDEGERMGWRYGPPES